MAEFSPSSDMMPEGKTLSSAQPSTVQVRFAIRERVCMRLGPRGKRLYSPHGTAKVIGDQNILKNHPCDFQCARHAFELEQKSIKGDMAISAGAQTPFPISPHVLGQKERARLNYAGQGWGSLPARWPGG